MKSDLTAEGPVETGCGLSCQALPATADRNTGHPVSERPSVERSCNACGRVRVVSKPHYLAVGDAGATLSAGPLRN